MLDIQVLRNQIDTVADRLASRGMQLDSALFIELEDERKQLQTRTQELQAGATPCPNRLACSRRRARTPLRC